MNYYVGIDLHKYYSYIVVKDEKGSQVKKGRVENDRKVLTEFFKELTGANVIMVIEATSNYYWMYETLSELGGVVKLAHPKKTKAIASAKIKNDKIDANMLSDLLRANLIPESYIPTPDIRYLRELLRHRVRLVRQRANVKNQINVILMKLNLTYLTGQQGNIFSKRGIQWVKDLDIPLVFQWQRDNLLAQLEFFNTQIKDIEDKIKQKASDYPAMEKLLAIPGISYFSGLLILSEIGDINRFPSPKKLASYAGLTPSLDESGGHRRLGHITHEGSPYLRWILCEISKHFVYSPGPLRAFYLRIKNNKGFGKATVAVARKIVTGLYFVLKYNVDFAPKVNCSY